MPIQLNNLNIIHQINMLNNQHIIKVYYQMIIQNYKLKDMMIDQQYLIILMKFMLLLQHNHHIEQQ
jgi:hypothetical protein